MKSESLWEVTEHTQQFVEDEIVGNQINRSFSHRNRDNRDFPRNRGERNQKFQRKWPFCR